MTEDLASTAAMLGLKVSTRKTKRMRMSHVSDAAIILHGNVVEEVNEFTYLGSKMTTDGDSESEIKASLSKAGQAFASFKNIWKSEISLKTKLHFVKSYVLTGYTAAWVRVTEVHESHRRKTRCFRRILNIFWRNIISNSELHRTTSTKQHQF